MEEDTTDEAINFAFKVNVFESLEIVFNKEEVLERES